MAGSVSNPRIWLAADCYRAVLGSTAPTDTTTALAAAWKAFGLLSSDGATESRNQDSNDFYAWGNILVRNVRSKHKRQIKVTALEDNLVVWGLVNPGSSAVTATSITTRTVKVPTSDIAAYLLQTSDGSIIRRRVMPRGEVVEVGDVTFKDSDMQGFELTIDIYPDSAGILYYDITDDPQAVTP